MSATPKPESAKAPSDANDPRDVRTESISDRVTTVSSVPISRESRVSSRRILDVDSAWLDRLVVATCEMPVAEGETAVAEFLVRAIGEIFPECGVGACLVPLEDSPAPQKIFKYVPEGEEHRGEGMDPTRLFPGFTCERVLVIEDTGSTLHLASDDGQLDDDESPMVHVLKRAALAARRGIVFARGHAKARDDAKHLRALNSHMVQAEKLASLGQIAAGVVHELNNPLTSIVAYTDWLIRKLGPAGDPDSLERLRRIGESSSRILRFTRDLVAYARPSSEVPVPVSITQVVEQALAFCEHVLAQHSAGVERRFAESLPAVRGMHEQLVQVFVNLFTNACHAMPESGGHLTVSTRVEAPDTSKARVVVLVEDNGHGIAPDHLSQIFAPFFTTKVDGRGTGLGLSIVKNIIDNHNADIRAERGDSGGARFILSFPVVM